MHPRVFLESFWRADLRDEVFVAMSFDSKFDRTWRNIFVPAIEDHPISGKTLRAIRPDVRKSGDSILSEIIDGIAHSQLFLADISVTNRWDEGGETRWCRNGNVMYEVGLALAFRQPVEVILVRDDNESLLFDVSHIPVLRFDPMDEPGSVTLIRRVIEERLKERDLGGDLRVQKIVESLTEHELEITGSFGMHSHFGWKGGPLSAGVLAIPRLLEKGVLRLTEVPRAGNAAMYAWTPLGRVVADMVGRNRETLH